MSFDKLLNIADHASTSHISINTTALEILEDALDGNITIVDASNPFVYLMEVSAVNAAASTIKAQELTNKQHRGLVTNIEDLLIHMSDADHIDRFSKPASHTVAFWINKAQLIERAILDPVTGFKKAIIPKDTQWYAGGYYFYQHWPINVDISPGGDIVTYFDTTIETPLKTARNNIISSRIAVEEDQEVVVFRIPVDELRMTSTSSPITSSTGFRATIPFENKFYYARVYHTDDNITWKEMITTHTREVYDVTKPTMILKVVDGRLEARLPEIYITNGLVGNNARIDVYTTNGAVNVDLGSLLINQWNVDWNDPSNQAGDYSEAFINAQTIKIGSDGIMEGGHDGVSFEDLKDSVLYGLDGKVSAVTDAELTNQLNKRGYNVTVQKDTVADRVYVATSKLPVPAKDDLTSVPGTICSSIFLDETRADIDDVIVRNTNSITVRSGALFTETINGLGLAADTTRAELDGLSNYELVTRLNSEDHYYNPFHYVLDSTNSLFEARAYYLDDAKETDRIYSRSNLDLGLSFRGNNTTVELMDNNYVITVTAENTNNVTGAKLYMVYTNYLNQKFYIKADQVIVDGTTSTFTFTLETTLLINRESRIIVSNLFNSLHAQEDVEVDLVSDFTFIYIVEGVVTPSNFDNLVPNGSNLNPFSACSLEQSTISFGQLLEPLYSKSRSLATEAEYEVHDSDVFETYPTDVPERDAVGIIHLVDSGGNVTIPIKHHKGDIMLNDEGEPDIIAAKGSLKLNAQGEVTLLRPQRISKEIRMFLVDIKYLYATNEDIVSYRERLPAVVINRLDEITDYRPELQGRTKLFYEPRSSDISSVVRINSRKQARVNTAVQFTVSITVRASDHDNLGLRDLTESAMRVIIGNAMAKTTYSFSDLLSELGAVGGDSIIGVNFTSSLPGDTATLEDLNTSFSIKSRIIPGTNGLLDIEDSIDFDWVKG